jgi:hypothetical protein
VIPRIGNMCGLNAGNRYRHRNNSRLITTLRYKVHFTQLIEYSFGLQCECNQNRIPSGTLQFSEIYNIFFSVDTIFQSLSVLSLYQNFLETTEPIWSHHVESFAFAIMICSVWDSHNPLLFSLWLITKFQQVTRRVLLVV